MHVNPYLFFDGKCEEALEFYKSKAGAKVTALMRFKEAPDQTGMSPDAKDKVMHAEFTVGETKILASDGYCKNAPRFEGFSLTIQCADDGEAAKLYNALGEGGQVTMPLGKTFFASSFGMITDKFGVGWMVIAG